MIARRMVQLHPCGHPLTSAERAAVSGSLTALWDGPGFDFPHFHGPRPIATGQRRPVRTHGQAENRILMSVPLLDQGIAIGVETADHALPASGKDGCAVTSVGDGKCRRAMAADDP